MGGNRSRIPTTGKRGEQDGRAGGSCEQQNPLGPKWPVVRDVIVTEAGSFVYSPDLFLSRLALPTHTAEPPSQVCAVVLVIPFRGSVFFLSVQSLYVPVSDERRERATARENTAVDQRVRGSPTKREGGT